MGKTPKIPLETRLQKAGSHTGGFLPAFAMYVDTYFRAMGQICENPYFEEVYQKDIFKYTRGKIRALAEIAYMADSLPQKERARLLYKILVEPFALMEENKRKETGI